MTPSPIPKVLSTFLARKVKALLIGGQACILYGAAEFSRDIDLAIMVSPENLEDLKRALEELAAERIFYPSLPFPPSPGLTHVFSPGITIPHCNS